MEVFNCLLEKAREKEEGVRGGGWGGEWVVVLEAISKMKIILEKSELIPIRRVANVEELALELGCKPNFWNDPKIAIKNAYRATDKYILENSMKLGPGGSTAVTAIVIDGKDLWVANIGDSRAVVCERGAANQLTVDHEPDSERRRIEKQGGFVTNLAGDVPRVNGQLAVARAFGDQSLKAHLSSEPDVRHVPIDSTIEFVILASDGLWKLSMLYSMFALE
ncbi:putative protein phosphatase 2C 44 [Vitis vinifera]|uniref:PPM-type phosphatase domain-containing protein n=1 Tax=Vitis vinifera TaxID=29760 RepID=A0A438IBS3_VITVI|nr:putative protein phosphatase 2C 44 [Vitis vinifera]